MSFEEKLTWVNLFVTLGVATTYFVVVLTPLGEVPAAEIAYQRPLLIAVGASIVLTIAGAILAAIGTAISSELSGQGTVEDIDRKDERDVEFNRRGDLLGYYVASVGALGVMALTMLESEYFWIANTLYLSFVAAALVSGVVKLVLYHRGY
jgi:hypothetical protein